MGQDGRQGDQERSDCSAVIITTIHADEALRVAGDPAMKQRGGRMLQWVVKIYRIWSWVVGVGEKAEVRLEISEGV